MGTGGFGTIRRAGEGCRKLRQRLGRCQAGTAAIEFAMVLVPFIGLTLAIIETATLMFTDSVVQGAVMTAARLIRTGQLQAGIGSTQSQQATTLTAFQTAVCADVFSQISCNSLTFDVRNFTSFAAISLPAPTFDNNGNVTNASFNTGASSLMAGASSIVTVRVIYVWSPITPGLTYLLGAGAGQAYTMIYTVIMRNEPF